MAAVRGVRSTLRVGLVTALVATSLGGPISPSSAAAGGVAGTVFEDRDHNGVRDVGEPALEGVTITATDVDGVATSGVTAADGRYDVSLAPLAEGGYRIDATLPALLTGLEPAPLSLVATGVRNRGNVQFGSANSPVAPGAAGYDIGFVDPASFCQDNPDVATTCFVGGPSDTNTTADTIVGWDYDTTTTALDHLATKAQTGSVWAMGYHRTSDALITGAFTKRFTAYGPSGTGAVYAVQPDGSVDTVITLSGGPDNHGDLTLDTGDDATIWDSVGKTALGDIEVDGNTAYVWNQFTRQLVQVDLTQSPGAGTGTVQTSYAMPNPGTGATGCPAPPAGVTDQMVNLRPGGVAVHRGQVYVTVTCTAESVSGQTNNNTRAGENTPNADAVVRAAFLRGFVYRLDGASFTQVANMPLDYPRGCASQDGSPCGDANDLLARWLPWAPEGDTQFGPTGTQYGQVSYPQPWLTDVDFDPSGAMLVGVADRFGHQSGNEAAGADTGLQEGVSAGDLLRLAPETDGTFTLEDNGSSGSLTGAGVSNGQGPGGGEFFAFDTYTDTHQEVTLGGLGTHPGRFEVITAVFDPTSNVRSGGVHYYSTTDGTRTDALQIFGQDASATFGKVAGIGDIAIRCDAAPIEIGDRVWFDSDNDGIQDAGEPGLSGVAVALFDSGGAPAGTATTDADGRWSLPIDPDATYTVTLDPSGVASGDLPPGVQASDLQPVTTTAGGDARVDSDASDVAGTPTITVAEHLAGQNDPDYDAGFYASPRLRLGNVLWFDADDDGTLQAGEDRVVGATVEVWLDADASGDFDPTLDTVAGSVDTDANGFYVVGDLDPGTYFVVVPGGQGVLAGTRSSAGATQDATTDSVDDGVPQTGYAAVSRAIDLQPGAQPQNEQTPGNVVGQDETDADAATGSHRDTDSNLTVDFGFVPLYAIGNEVFFDANDNGVRDGAEVGIPDVEVALLRGGAVLDTSTTVGGAYAFDGLVAGDYVVRILASNFDPGGPLEGFRSSTDIATTAGDNQTDQDDNGVGVAGSGDIDSPAITLGDGEPLGENPTSATAAADGNADLTIDFGFTRPAAYGDRVFFDANGNGAQDPDEPGLNGITVNLFDGAGDPAGSDTTANDGTEDGIYGFGDLVPGDYSAVVVAPAGTEFTTQDAAADTIDSDADASGAIAVTTLDPGEVDLTHDAGIVVVASLAIAKQVQDPDDGTWYDADTAPVRFLTGDAADYRFLVTNDGDPGDASFATLTITDDLLACSPIDVDLSGVGGVLDPGESVTVPAGCGLTITAATTNTAAVTGPPTNPSGTTFDDVLGLPEGTVLAPNPSNGAQATPVDPAIEIVKSPAAQVVTPDQGDLTFTLEVRNTSTGVPQLQDVVVADTQCDATPVLTGGDANNNDLLDAGETWTYSCTVSAPVGGWSTSFTNTADVTADVPALDPDGEPLPASPPVTDDDTATVTVADILIDKLVRERPAGAYVDDDLVPDGADVDWQVTIRNDGDAVIESLTLTDDSCPEFDGIASADIPPGQVTVTGDTAGDGTATFSPDEQWVLTCGTDNVVAAVSNTLTLEGTPEGGTTPIVVADTATATPLKPHVSVVIQIIDPVSGSPVDADGIAGTEGSNDGSVVAIESGDDVTYQVTVFNPDSGLDASAGLTLTDVEVLVELPDGSTTTLTLASLAPGTSSTFPIVVDGAVTDAGTATATVTAGGSTRGGEEFGPVDGTDGDQDANDVDTAVTVLADVELRKLVADPDGVFQDANAPDSVLALAGADVTYRIEVENTGSAPLEDVLVDDAIDGCTLTPIGGAGTGVLAPGATWTYECTVSGGFDGLTDIVTNVATVVGTPTDGAGTPVGTDVQDDDEANVDVVAPASLGDQVFQDLDDDGIRDGGEPGVDGITVTLLDDGGNVVAVDTTEDGGLYLFQDLFPGDYTVVFSGLPPGAEFSDQGVGDDDAVDSDPDPASGETDVITLEEGEVDLDIDAGIFLPASLGDYVWIDTDLDGLQGDAADEPPVPDVVVELLQGGVVIDDTTTNGVGFYEFTGLTAGDYQVRFTAPSGTVFTTPNNPADEALDSDAVPDVADPTLGLTAVITLEAGQNDPDWDAGLVELSSISNLIFDDRDRDGLQGTGELGYPGVVVTLLDASGNRVAGVEEQTTGADGVYLFDGLPPGQYRVEVALPPGVVLSPPNVGGDDAIDSDVDPAEVTGRLVTEVIDLAPGVADDSWDAGVYVVSSLGDRVWNDVNRDGLQGDPADEPGIVGALVELLRDGDVIDDTLSGTNGIYSFPDLSPGTYQIRVTPPDGIDYTFTTSNNPADDARDSDVVAVDGQVYAQTGDIVLGANVDDQTWDAGLYQPASIGDRVFLDEDADGLQDDSEVGVEGVLVVLYLDGAATGDQDTTDDQGDYRFGGLAPGDYQVQFFPPDGFSLSPADQGGPDDDDIDSDADPATGLTPVIPLLAGQSIPTVDAGLFQSASLGDTVWRDDNRDGIHDVGTEPGIVGVSVELLDAGGTVIDTTTTGPNGFYVFADLVPGTYQVRVVNPEAAVWTPTLQDAGDPNDDALDSDADPDTGLLPQVTLVSGESNPTLDAGFWRDSSLGDTVFLDRDRDGVQDGDGEPGIPGVTVRLLDTDGNPTGQTDVTDVDGNYRFEDLAPGNYLIEVVPPEGYVISPQDQGDDDATDSDVGDATGPDPGRTDVIALPENTDDPTRDAGLYLPASIGDTVFNDLDQDGLQDSTEDGVPNVAVTLSDAFGASVTILTDEDGNYGFDDLFPGDYTITVTLPFGASFSPQDQGGDDAADSDIDPATGTTVTITLVEGQDDDTQDAGVYFPAGLGDRIFEDLNANGVQDGPSAPDAGDGEPGLPGATVTLFDDDGNQVGDAQVTGPDGSYLFQDLPAGTYDVLVEPPAGYLPSPQDVGEPNDDTADSDADPDTGLIEDITLVALDDDRTNDAGFYRPAALGDKVFEDDNADGIQDPFEDGIPAVTVTLIDADGNAVTDADGDPVGSQVTGGDGSYLFEGLNPGDYIVVFSDLPDSAVFTLPDVGNDATDSDVVLVVLDDVTGAVLTGATDVISLVSGQVDLANDAGMVIPASIAGTVFDDVDNDGIQEPGEAGIPGIVVTLTDGFGGSVTTTTGPDGEYLFEGLPPGDYTVVVTNPDGTVFSPVDQGDDDTVDSDVDPTGMTPTIPLVSGDDITDVDAGVFTPASLAGTIWSDLDGDGVNDPDEPSLSGIPVALVDDDGNVVDEAATDGNGDYLFEDVAPGDYTVVVTTPVGSIPTQPNVGDDDTVDSDAIDGVIGPVPLVAGDNSVDNDAGFVPVGSIGGTVFEDTNGSGVKDPNEPGVPGVTVTLLDGDGNQVDEVVTGADGTYLFDELPAGTYEVVVTPPDGYVETVPNAGGDDATDSDIVGGATGPIELGLGETNDTVDAGLVQLGSIAGTVFADGDADGVEDPSDAPVPGLTVTLTDGDGNVRITTTDEDGDYLFDGLPPGDYVVNVTAPDGSVFSPADQGGDDTVDSDVSPAGVSPIIPLGSGEDVTDVDAGLVIPALITGTVFDDQDGDGIQEPDEVGVPDVPVIITDDSTGVEIIVVTDENGDYAIEVPPGTYVVTLMPPVSVVLSPQDQGDDDRVDSDFDPATGVAGPVTLQAGDVADLDAGVTPVDIDLAITKTVIAVADTNAVFELVVSNVGTVTDTSTITVIDQVPVELPIISIESGSGWNCSQDGQLVTCRLPGGLAAGASSAAVRIVTVLPAAGVRVVNAASVSSEVLESVLTNNDDGAEVTGDAASTPPPPPIDPVLPVTGADATTMYAYALLFLLLGLAMTQAGRDPRRRLAHVLPRTRGDWMRARARAERQWSDLQHDDTSLADRFTPREG